MMFDAHRSLLMPVPNSATPTYVGMQPLTLAGGTVAASALGQTPRLVYSVPVAAASFMTLRSPNSWMSGSWGNKVRDETSSSYNSRGFVWRCRFAFFGLSTPLRFFLGLQGTSLAAIPALTNVDVEANATNIIGIAFDSTFDFYKMRVVSKGNVNGSFDIDLLNATGGTDGGGFGFDPYYDLTISSFPIYEDLGPIGGPIPSQEYTYSVSIKKYESGKCWEGSALITSPAGSPKLAPDRGNQFGFTSILSNAGVAKTSSQQLHIHGMSSQGIITAPALPLIT